MTAHSSDSIHLPELKDEPSEHGSDSLLLDESFRSDQYGTSRRRISWIWLVHLGWFITYVVVLFVAVATRSAAPRNCVEKHSAFCQFLAQPTSTVVKKSNVLTFLVASPAPALGLIDEEYQTVRFRGSFSFPSPYKGPPSPSVDNAWNNLTTLGAMKIPEEAFAKLNASVHSVKVPEELGGGRLALFEFVHQIHCVQMMWMATYPEYYREEYNFSIAHPDQWHEHIDHCADLLRQKFMCDADVGIVTYNWQKHHYAPHPNFNVEHKCRDFDAVMGYVADHQIDVSSLEKNYFTRPDEPVVDFEEPPFDPLAED